MGLGRYHSSLVSTAGLAPSGAFLFGEHPEKDSHHAH